MKKILFLTIAITTCLLPSKQNDLIGMSNSLNTLPATLPQGYEQVEHVNFAFGSTLDTGYCFDTSLNDIEIIFHYKGAIPYKSFGTDTGGQVIQSYGESLMMTGGGGVIYIGSGLDAYYSSITTFDLKITNGTSVELDFNDRVYNATLAHTIETLTNQKSILFGKTNVAYNGEYKGLFNGALYDFSIYENDIMVKNFVPCKNLETNKIGFYETVSNTFITSISNYDFYYVKGVNGLNIAYQDNESTTLTPINDRLYLSSYTDFSDMDGKLLLDNGAILTGSINGTSLTVGQDSLDLTTIFGEMEAGTIYPLTIAYGDIVGTVELIKASNIASVFITSSKSYTQISQSNDVIATGEILLNDGETSISDSVKKLKMRGNHNSIGQKNQFNINLDHKRQLIPGAKSQKKFALVNSDHLMNQFGYTLYQQVCKNSDAIQYRFVNLYFNNDYIGIYMLTERVKIGKEVVDVTEPDMTEGTTTRTVTSDSLNITNEEQAVLDAGITSFKYCPDTVVKSDGGFIIEAGFYHYKALSCFTTSHGNTWELKDPEALSLAQISKIAIYIQKAEDALFSETGFNALGKNYTDLYDLDSIAREFLVRCFTTDTDFYITSNYLYIDGDNDGLKGKIYGGPMWDLNVLDEGVTTLYNHKVVETSAYRFREKLMEKGDFIYNLNSINRDELSNVLDEMTDPNNESIPTVHSLYSDYLASRTVDDYRWNCNRANNSLRIKNFILNRKTGWTDIWSDQTNALRGVSIHKDAGSNQLVADAVSATSYQWYKVNVSDYTSTAISGATSSVYTPNGLGCYYVEVSGTPLAGCPNSSSLISNAINLLKATVSFNMQGHGKQILSQAGLIGSKTAMPPNPYESGYVFKGWYKEAECTNRWNFANDEISGDLTLFAKWVENGTLFTTSTVSLNDYTWLNTYTELVDDDYQQYTFKFKIRDGQVTDLDSSLIQKVNHKWRLTVILLPYQLADDITFYIYDLNDHLICTKVDSVRSYGTRLLANSTDANEKSAMIALLNYGAAVQILKGYHTDDLANRDLPVNS